MLSTMCTAVYFTGLLYPSMFYRMLFMLREYTISGSLNTMFLQSCICHSPAKINTFGEQKVEYSGLLYNTMKGHHTDRCAGHRVPPAPYLADQSTRPSAGAMPAFPDRGTPRSGASLLQRSGDLAFTALLLHPPWSEEITPGGR